MSVDLSQLQEEIAVLRKMLLDVWPPRGVPAQVATTGGGMIPVALAMASGTATTDFTYNVTSLDGTINYGNGLLAKWGRIIPGAYCIAATRGIGFFVPSGVQGQVPPEQRAGDLSVGQTANGTFVLEIAYETYEVALCT